MKVPKTVQELVFPIIRREAAEMGATLGKERVELTEAQFATLSAHLVVAAFHSAHAIATQFPNLCADDDFLRWSNAGAQRQAGRNHEA